jgi:hypothetical protein
MRTVAPGIGLLEYPLTVLGAQLGRRTTLLGCDSGALVIHSTAPFTDPDVRAIRAFGRPAWLVEATLFHDTFAKVGRARFPDVPYLAPPGFAQRFDALPLLPLPGDWPAEIEVLELAGMPGLREHACFHARSRTLVVADLVFNFGPSATPWTRFFFRGLPGIRRYPGVSRLFKSMIRDRPAFDASIQRMLEWDFDRLIPAHGDVIDSGGKALLQRALADAGLL